MRPVRPPLIRSAVGLALVAAGPWFFLASDAVARQGDQPRLPPGETDAFINRQRFIEQQARQALDREVPTADRFSLDVGGWWDAYIMMFDDGVNSSRTQRQTNLRVYGALSLDRGIHTGYVRMKMGWTDWNRGDSYTPNEDDFEGPNLERGWYELDLRKAAQYYGNRELPFDLKFRIGRDFVQTGTGYGVALPLDHVALIGEWAKFETTFIAGKTPDSTENIDRSRPVADSSNRNFFILQERYKGFEKHEPFFYWAYQSDHTSEDPLDLLQNYQYDSQYFGFGSTGEIVKNLRYSTEWIIERGTSYGDRRFLHTDEIKAWAFDQMLEYFIEHSTQPKLVFEYMFASGDPDRLGSPTNAVGGNRRDHVDNSFVGFGYRDTGLALAPRLSNIHVWRAGGSFRPFPDIKEVKNLELGTDWFLFAKNRSRAAISDPLADQQSGYVGWEMDYYANYRITSDVSWTIRFGSFFPGDAFSDQTTRTFALTGVTWSF